MFGGKGPNNGGSEESGKDHGSTHVGRWRATNGLLSKWHNAASLDIGWTYRDLEAFGDIRS